MSSKFEASAPVTRRDEVTSGHLLGGRVVYMQPRFGFRSGIEPVLLAATIPARQGAHVVEAGCGAGAALLCLAARVPGVHGLGVDLDPEVVALASCNAAANRQPDLRFMAADIASLPPPVEAFDHAFANPPYHSDAGTASPNASRQAAKRAAEGLLGTWAAALGRRLRPRGTLTFILPTASLPQAAVAFTAAGCSPTAMLPIWPKAGRPAKLMLLSGIKGSRAPFRVLPGLTLHREDGAYTAAADAILRDGKALDC